MWVFSIFINLITADPMNGIRTMKEAFKSYCRSYFFLDLTATAPSVTLLLLKKRSIGKYFMLIRFSRFF